MKVIKNILSPDLAFSLYSATIDIVNGVNSKNNTFSINTWTSAMWPSFLTEGSTPVIVYKVQGEAREAIIKNLKEKDVFTENEIQKIPTEFSTMIYVWLRHSFINLHSDNHTDKAITVYLNPSWEFKEGGFFQWFDPAKEEWQTIVPSFNTGVVNDKNYDHATTPVTSLTQYRISLQCFFGRKD